MRHQSGLLHLAAASVMALLGVVAPTGANANTITQFVTMTSPYYTAAGPGSSSFAQFDPAAGTLNAVTLQYTVNGVTPYAIFVASSGDYMFYDLYDPSYQTHLATSNNHGISGSVGLGISFLTASDTFLAQYIGLGTLTLKESISRYYSSDWVAINGTPNNGTPQIAITYDFTAAATPLPAGLPLFASGLGALGLLGWRRKRKNAALADA